jgi:DHA1 family inner membrane transport protein
MSWVAAAYFAAPILLVPAGSWLADRLGWRAVYVVFAVAAAGLVAALWRRVPMEHAERMNAKGRRLRLGAGKIVNGYLLFFKSRTTAAGAVSAFFVSGGITVFILYLGAHLGESFGLSVTQVGLVFLLSGLASLGGALGAGPLSDRIGKRPVAVGGSLALAGLASLVPVLQAGIGLYACLGMVGLAAASRVAPLQSLITELVDREKRGAYVALRDTLSQLGIAVSASAGAILYARGGFAFVCYFAACLSGLAAALLWLIGEPVARNEPASTKS